MSELKIVASIVAKEECKDGVLKAIQKVADKTRMEEGNVSYDLHVNTKKPLVFVLIEVWKSDEAIQIHNESNHFQEFVKEIDGKIDALEIDTIKHIY